MGWWLTAKPGDRVVMVVDYDFVTKLDAIRAGVSLPLLGQVYTVRDLCERLGEPCVRVNEIVNDHRFYCELGFSDEQAFSARRFHPVVSRPTDISVFTAMLTGKPAKADA